MRKGSAIRWSVIRPNVAILAALVVGMPSHGQSLPIDPDPLQAQDQRDRQAANGLRDVSRTGDTGTGAIGQRQTREDAAPNIDPLARIDNRVQNRIQNRIRNRIDRNYDPTANVSSPFRQAEDEARRTEKPKPR